MRYETERGRDAVGFEHELKQLAAAIASAHEVGERAGSGGELAALVDELQTAEEELRVADEEVRQQHDELGRLVSRQQVRRWQHERLLAVLPSPVVVTNRDGAMKSVNAAAASLFGMRIDRLLRRPIQTLIDPKDRPGVRRDLAAAVRDETGFRRPVTLLPRHARPVDLEALVTVDRDATTREVEVSWLLLSPQEHLVLTQNPAGAMATARALVELTQVPLHAREPQGVLSTVAMICQRAMGGGIEVSVTVGEPAEPTLVASTSRLAQQLDGAQVMTGEGPCEEAWRSRRAVVSPDLHTDRRWPRLARAIAGLPVLGAAAVPIEVGEDLLGALNVYGRDRLRSAQVMTADLLVAAVAAVLHEFEVRSELEATARNYRAALTSRATIDQAKGILMGRLGQGQDEAFSALATISSLQNRKLREVAETLVQAAALGELDQVLQPLLAGMVDPPGPA